MKLPAPIEAIIFDMDGTLVDTEPVHCSAWLKVLTDRGFNYDESWFEQWIGTSDRILTEAVIAEHRLAIPARELQLAKQDLFHREVVHSATLYPGVKEALTVLHQRLPLALATNSSSEDARHVFIPTQLDQYLDKVVTASDVPRLKPAPDMYLLAAQELGVNPSNCLAVEDSPAGAQAAISAGMYVLGLTSSQAAEKMPAVAELLPQPEAALQRLIELTSLVQARFA